MTANDLTKRLLLEIPRRFPARVWRVNVLAGMLPSAGGMRMVRSSLPGMADISGILGPHGQRLEIEVKVGRDRLRPEQKSFGEMIAAHGGLFIEARTLEQCCADLQREIARMERLS